MLLVLITASLLYLIRLVECRTKLPDSRVIAIVYQQSTDSFSLVTQPIPWWSVRGLADQIPFRTITPDDELDGLYPNHAFRKREIVDYPDPTMDQFFPGYILSDELPEGKAYGPTKIWEMVETVRFEHGQWQLAFEQVHLHDTDLANPTLVKQYRNYDPASVPNENGYVFHIQAMGGIASRGLGRAHEPSFRDQLRYAIMDVLTMF